MCVSTYLFSEMIKKQDCHSEEFNLMSTTNRAPIFFVKNTIMGGPTDKGHMELMTDFWAGKIFDNLRTKEKGQVSLFWAWDDRKNVRNFSMLIIMAARGRFRLFSPLKIHLQLNSDGVLFAPSRITPEQIEDKKCGTAQFFNVWLSVHGKHCVNNF